MVHSLLELQNVSFVRNGRSIPLAYSEKLLSLDTRQSINRRITVAPGCIFQFTFRLLSDVSCSNECLFSMLLNVPTITFNVEGKLGGMAKFQFNLKERLVYFPLCEDSFEISPC